MRAGPAACAVCGDVESREVHVGTDDLALSTRLCSRHAAGLLTAAAGWLVRQERHHAEPKLVGGRRLQADEDLAQMRRWASEQGLPVASRGSLSHAVVAAYRAAHPGLSAG